MSEALSGLNGRVTAAGGAKDRVITADGMARALKGIPLEVMDLGIHEYPFTIPGPLGEAYTTSLGRRLVVEIGRSSAIGAPYRSLFETFIRKVASFL